MRPLRSNRVPLQTARWACLGSTFHGGAAHVPRSQKSYFDHAMGSDAGVRRCPACKAPGGRGGEKNPLAT
eukprot:339153-Chlamydomonas_euryale.AAC.1